MVDFPFPLFRHLDFTRIAAPEDGAANELGECLNCGTIFRSAATEALMDIDTFYRTDEYAAHDEVHAIPRPGTTEQVPAARIQAEILAELLPAHAPRILDFGCFNGRLLREFSVLRPDAVLVGYDVADRPGFPTGDGFTFATGDWRDIDGPFDLVCLSHSIQYVREIAELLERIREWVAPGGAVFIQTPDIMKKACALLLGDLHFHFRPESLAAVLINLGFGVVVRSDFPFPHDITLIGRATQASAVMDHTAGKPILATAVDDIRKLAETVSAHRGANINGILGTTIEAAFVDEILDGIPQYFVDENPEKAGGKFRGREVVEPGSVPAGARVLVPLGDRSAVVAARLSKLHSAQFVAA